MGKTLTKLSTTLVSMMRARGLEANLSEYRIFETWDRAVGPVLARHARPARVRGKKLTLTVDNAAWMQQLSLLKPEIIEKVNAALGKQAITQIMLRLGEIAVMERVEEKAFPAVCLDRADRETIERCLSTIRDPETRAAVQRVIEKDFQHKKRIQKS